MKTRLRKNRATSIPTSRWLAYATAGAATRTGWRFNAPRARSITPGESITYFQLTRSSRFSCRSINQEIRSLSCAGRSRRTFSGCVVRRAMHSSVRPASVSGPPMSSGSTNGIKTSIFHKSLSPAPGWELRERLGRWSKEIVQVCIGVGLRQRHRLCQFSFQQWLW